MNGKNENIKGRNSVQGRTSSIAISNSPAIPMTRAYYSSYHLWAAKHFCILARNIENEVEGQLPFDIRHRSYITNCIFSAVAFLEAVINELYQDVADGHKGYIANLDSDNKRLISDFWEFIEKFNLLDKFQIASTFLRKQQFDVGQLPYQDAKLVVALRNELVHFKPKSLGGKIEHKLTQRLRGKFPENRLMSGTGNPWFPDKCLGYGCAEWAITSVTNFADQFLATINVEPNYKKVEFNPLPDET